MSCPSPFPTVLPLPPSWLATIVLACPLSGGLGELSKLSQSCLNSCLNASVALRKELFHLVLRPVQSALGPSLAPSPSVFSSQLPPVPRHDTPSVATQWYVLSASHSSSCSCSSTLTFITARKPLPPGSLLECQVWFWVPPMSLLLLFLPLSH